jgi:hypothetical protein
VSDKKIGHTSNGTSLDYYNPDIISATDYYPGGMVSRFSYLGNLSLGYRYGFNGQEKSDEIKGDGNSYTAEFWEYDPRLGRRWNLDPKPTVGISEYSAFDNSPIWHNDVKGDSAGPGQPTPNWQVGFGTTGGPWGPNRRTTILGIYGGRTYYNSTPNGAPGGIIGFLSNFTEVNLFAQVKKRVGDEHSNLQVGANWFKQKFDNKNGFGFEAPTAFHASLGWNKSISDIGKKITITGNLSLGAGVEFGKPRFDDASTTIPGGFRYKVIGVGASVIYRVDATYSNRISFFIAGTIHHMQTFEQESSAGTQASQINGSIGASAGFGINLGR